MMKLSSYDNNLELTTFTKISVSKITSYMVLWISSRQVKDWKLTIISSVDG